MSSRLFNIFNLILLISITLVQSRNKRQSRLLMHSNLLDDSSIESHQANEQQLEQFTQLIFTRLNLKQPPNVTINNHDGSGIPSIIKQLEKENLHQTEEVPFNQQQQKKINQLILLLKLYSKTRSSFAWFPFIANNTIQQLRVCEKRARARIPFYFIYLLF